MKDSHNTLFQDIYNTHADSLFRYCLLLTKDREKAKDCTQEVFVRFFEYLQSGKKVTHPKAFLFKTAKNYVIDQSRKKKALSLDDMTEDGFDPISTRLSDAVQTQSALYQELAYLQKTHPEAYELVALRHAYNMSISEMAEIFHTNENTMSVRIHRALQLLQESSREKI